MKKILILMAILVTSCSQNNQDSSPTIVDEQSEVVKEFDISNLLPENFTVIPDTGNLGETSSTLKEISIILTLSNKNITSMPLVISLQSSLGYSIKLNRCGSILAPKAKCQLTISFSSRNLYDGTYPGSVDINTGIIPLTAKITGSPNPLTTGDPVLSYVFSNGKKFSDPSELPYREITVSNTGTGLAKELSIPLLGEGYSIRLNRCPSSLMPKQSCTIQILYKESRSGNPAPEKGIVFRFKSPSDQVSLKSLNSHTAEVTDFNPDVSPVFSANFPSDTKTEVCSGSETVFKELIDCVNSFGDSVTLSQCSSFPIPQHTYQSPAGEKTEFEDLGNSNKLYKKCELGQTIESNSRVECMEPTYFPNQSTFTCDLDSFLGEYFSATNPVPNACNGTQVVEKPLIPGSCVGVISNQTEADQYCNQTQSETFESPIGEYLPPEPISGGQKTRICAKGESTYSTDVSCFPGFHKGSNLTCDDVTPDSNSWKYSESSNGWTTNGSGELIPYPFQQSSRVITGITAPVKLIISSRLDYSGIAGGNGGCPSIASTHNGSYVSGEYLTVQNNSYSSNCTMSFDIAPDQPFSVKVSPATCSCWPGQSNQCNLYLSMHIQYNGEIISYNDMGLVRSMSSGFCSWF